MLLAYSLKKSKMWSAILIDAKRNKLSLEFIIELTNGTDSFTVNHIGNRASAEAYVRDQLAQLERIDQILADKETWLGPVTLSPAPVDNRTQAELDFVADLTLLQKLNSAVTQGILTTADSQVSAIRGRIRTALLANQGWIKYF